MPEIDYDKSNVKVSKVDYEFNKLSLKKDEKARVLLIEKNPVFEWTHELKRPKIVEGEPIYTMTNPPRGEPRKVNDMDFIGRPICLGDLGTLEEDGIDPKSCPACAMAAKDPEAVKPPVRRFATHIIRYKTKAGSFTPAVPFQVEVLVWAFTERMFGQIAEFKEEWTDMRAHDLLMTCTNVQFQNYEINVAREAAWMESEQTRELTKAIYAGGRIADLSVACGRKTEKRWIDDDLTKIREAWAEVHAFERGTTTSLADDLSSITDDKAWEPEPKSAAPAAATADAAGLDDIFDGIEDAPAKEAITDSSDALSDLDDIETGAAAPAVEEEPEEAPAPPKAAAKAPAKKAAAPAAPAASVEDDLDALLA